MAPFQNCYQGTLSKYGINQKLIKIVIKKKFQTIQKIVNFFFGFTSTQNVL